MSNVQRIARNTAVLLISNIASFVTGFFFTMYVARYLGAQGYGILSFALAFTAIFGVLTDIGLQTLMIREIARDKALAQKYLGNIAALKILLCIVTFGLIALTINLMDYPWETIKVVYLIGLSVVFSAFSSMFYGVFRAHQRMEFEAVGQVLGSVLTLAGALYAISHDFSVASFAWIYFIVSLITLGYSIFISIWKFAIPRIKFDLEFWKDALKQAWPFALAAVFGSLYYCIDSIMLSTMKGDAAVGWYNAAYRLISILSFVPTAYFGAVFPITSTFHITSKEFLRFTHEKSFKYLLILGVPIGVGTTILANKIIMLIFGMEYYPSIIVLQILAWWMAVIFVTSVFGNLLQSANRQIMVAWVLAIGAILKVLLNLILIPGRSYTGASIATLATGFIVLALLFIWSSRIGYGIPIRNLIRIFIRISIASAAMCLFIIYLKSFYILALIPLSALLYFTVLYIIGGIEKDDVLLLRSVFVMQKAINPDENKDKS